MRPIPEAHCTESFDELRPQTDEVVSRYWERAYRFAAMITGNEQDSADIAQDALALAIRRLDQFDPGKGEFASWLWRIVLNVAREAGRASVRRASLFEKLQRDILADPSEDAEGCAIRRLSDEQLLNAVRALRLRPRTLIALRFGAQLSYAEIGTQIGISESAALMATRRALAVLRKQLED